MFHFTCKTALLIFLCIVHLLNERANCVIDEQDVLNERGEQLFRVYDGNTIKVPNRHRNKKPSIKFTLANALIEKIEQKNSSLWTLTLKDNSTVDFTVEDNGPVSEIYFLWHGGGPNTDREVCFHYGYNHASWYNAYQGTNSSWPMNVAKTKDKQRFTYLFDWDRYEGDMFNRNDRFGYSHSDLEHLFILEQLYFTSDGFALLMDHLSPLYIRRNTNGDDPVMCFSVNELPMHHIDKYGQPESGWDKGRYSYGNEDYYDIAFRIFYSTNIRTVSDHVISQSKYIPKPTAVPAEFMITAPTWFVRESGFKQERQFDLANYIFKTDFSKNNNFVFYGWSLNELDDAAKLDTFPSVENMTSYFYYSSFGNKRRNSLNYSYGMEIYGPTMSVSFLNEHDTINTQCDQFQYTHCTGFVNFSNPAACELLGTKLKNVHLSKNIDIFLLSASFTMMNMTVDYGHKDNKLWKYPILTTTKYIETASQVEGSTIISEYAFKSQHLPAWVRLTNFKSTPYEQLLAELIPNVLAVSMAGYSFIVPYSAGGFDVTVKPTDEQLIRMTQATALMPAMSFTRLPSDVVVNSTRNSPRLTDNTGLATPSPGPMGIVYYDESKYKTVSLVYHAIELHRKFVPTILELAKKRIQNGSPIVRPLWYVAPDDPLTYKINDQFMLGDDIVVAPVVVMGQRERKVYLPAGNWTDQHGKSYQGLGEYKVDAPLEEVPYFKRKN